MSRYNVIGYIAIQYDATMILPFRPFLKFLKLQAALNPTYKITLNFSKIKVASNPAHQNSIIKEFHSITKREFHFF